jgi:hypothetical protein
MVYATYCPAVGDALDDTLGKVLKDLRADLSDAEREAADKISARVAATRAIAARRAAQKFVAKHRQLVERHRALLADENPDALWPDGFDDAFIGLARRCGQPPIAAFSMASALLVLKARGMTSEEAHEFFEFNVVGSWMGPGTPIWVDDVDEDE